MKKGSIFLVLVIGLLIINSSPITLKSLTAKEEDYKELTQKLQNFIVAEYKRQKSTKGEVDIKNFKIERV